MYFGMKFLHLPRPSEGFCYNALQSYHCQGCCHPADPLYLNCAPIENKMRHPREFNQRRRSVKNCTADYTWLICILGYIRQALSNVFVNPAELSVAFPAGIPAAGQPRRQVWQNIPAARARVTWQAQVVLWNNTVAMFSSNSLLLHLFYHVFKETKCSVSSRCPWKHMMGRHKCAKVRTAANRLAVSWYDNVLSTCCSWTQGHRCDSGD